MARPGRIRVVRSVATIVALLAFAAGAQAPVARTPVIGVLMFTPLSETAQSRLRHAGALGLAIPRALALRADRLIE